MRYSIAGSLLCCAAAVQAFKDTSPFLLFSSSEIPSSMQIESQELDTASSVLQNTKNFLATCPSDVYIIIQQGGLAASDFSAINSVPNLKAAIADERSKTTYSVSEVVYQDGNLAEELISYIATTCGKDVERLVDGRVSTVGASGIIVSNIGLDGLPSEKEAREEQLNEIDIMLNTQVYEHLTTGPEYTVIITTAPVGYVLEGDRQDDPIYTPVFDATAHIDLKRDFGIRADNSSKKHDTRPLFEKYQFFTPGIFMGLVVGIVLLSILYVGLSAVSSLQVSYGAFDKEMGPSAQKKQQ